MATQEERLDIMEFNLRQFKTETIKAYGDMAYEMTMIEGLTKTSIERIGKLRETMEQRFDQANIRLDGMDAHLEHMDKRLDKIETTMATKEDLTAINKNLDLVGKLVTQILARLP